MQPQFVGPSYNLESRPAGVQRTVNLVPMPLEPGNERAGWGLEDVPGLALLPLVEPTACVVQDTFTAGLGAYTTVSGNSALFTITSDDYGNALHVASQDSITVSRIQRTFAAFDATRIVLRFKVHANADDDAASMGLYDAAVNRFYVIPRREAVFDTSRRCHIGLDGDVAITPSALSLGVWYELTIEMAAGAGASSWQLQNLSTGAVFAMGTFASDTPSIHVDSLSFLADSGGATCETSFDSVCIA